MYNLLPGSPRKKKTQVTNVRNKKGHCNELMDTKKIIKEYYAQLQAHKFHNLDEMEQFFERHNLLKLKQEEVNNLNSIISIK